MNPEHLKDLTTTAAGGTVSMAILATVRWELVPYGECVKVVVAVIFAVMGYKAYLGPKGGAAV